MKDSGYRWMIGPALTIAVLICGLATSWGVTKSSLDMMRLEVTKIEIVLGEHEDKIREIQIRQAGDSEILKNIQNSLEEIKEDLRILRSNSSGGKRKQNGN